MPEDFRAWQPERPRPRPSARHHSRSELERSWRRIELGDDVVAEVARQAAVRRTARLATRQRLFGRMRLSAPKPPRWLEAWNGLVLPVRLISAALVLVMLAALVALNLPWLKVQRVEVEGGSVIGRQQLLAAAGTQLGASTLLLNTGRMTSNLLAQPWVAQASVAIRWPGTVVVDVQALPPVLVYQRGRRKELLAASGAVLGPVPRLAATSPLPLLVDDRHGAAPQPGTVAEPADLTAALVALYHAFPAAYGVSASRFVISQTGSLLLLSSAGWTADLGPALTAAQIQSIGPKLEALRALATKLDLKSSGIKQIDLEDPSQVVVTP